MIGPQNGAVKSELGSLLNGVVNYEYWLPVPKMMYPGVGQMIAEYQARAVSVGADPFGVLRRPASVRPNASRRAGDHWDWFT
jgi:branched-chain amino acid transport system substrate-binding protein